MQSWRSDKRIVLWLAILYVVLATAAPFLHGHGWSGCAGPCQPSQHAVAQGQTTDGSAPCPVCQWEELYQAAPPVSLAWTPVERLVARSVPLPDTNPCASPRRRASSRAPPLPFSHF